MSLEPTYDWLSPEQVPDPVERATWARWCLRIDGRAVTRARDSGGTERDGLYGPLFPLAAWLVSNWWSLFYETDSVALERATLPGALEPRLPQEWRRRHCLRYADSSLCLPDVTVRSCGAQVLVSWSPDGNSSGFRFVEPGGEAFVGVADAQGALAGLVSAVVERTRDLNDPRTLGLARDWSATVGVDASASEFCRASGRLGLDPFDPEGWPQWLADWLESFPPGALDAPLVVDLLELPRSAEQRRTYVAPCIAVTERLGLIGSGRRRPDRRHNRAYLDGYAAARSVRKDLEASGGAEKVDLAKAAEAAIGRVYSLERQDDLPGPIGALVGWRDSGPTFAIHNKAAAPRFLLARALGMMLGGTANGPRALTDARTQDQRFSRAFAAELLAPGERVKSAYDEVIITTDHETAIDTLATRFEVSARVVEHQLQNHALLS